MKQQQAWRADISILNQLTLRTGSVMDLAPAQSYPVHIHLWNPLWVEQTH